MEPDIHRHPYTLPPPPPLHHVAEWLTHTPNFVCLRAVTRYDGTSGFGYWKVDGVNLSLQSRAAMRWFVGSVSAYGVQLDIFCIGSMLSCVQNNFYYILCFLGVYIDLDCKKNVWHILCYWGMQNINTMMKCVIYKKLD